MAEAIGATPATLAADWQFACKAGTEAMQAGIGLVGSSMVDYALGIGMDTAQGRPGDALEYTAGAGGAAYIVGPAEEALAVIQRTLSYVSDTTDFWRRPTTHYPSHAERFSGDPGYFGHVMPAAEEMMEIMGTRPEDYDYVVFHQPNPKFPTRALAELGFNAGAVEDRPAGAGDRQHLCRLGADRLVRGAGRGRTGPAHPHGQLRQRRRFGCLRPARHRPHRRGAAPRAR